MHNSCPLVKKERASAFELWLSNSVEGRVDDRADLINARHAVDAPHEPSRLVARQDRRGLGAVFGHAGAHGLPVVVLAPPEFGRAAGVAEARRLRRLEYVVI